MRPAYNFEPKYRVTMLTTELWTRGPGTPTAAKGLVWYTDGPRTLGGGPVFMDNLWEEGSVSLWENMLQFSWPKYMLSSSVLMKFK